MKTLELTQKEVKLLREIVNSSMIDEMLKESIEDETGEYPEELPELDELRDKIENLTE